MDNVLINWNEMVLLPVEKAAFDGYGCEEL
jgi:hypothetical protein